MKRMKLCILFVICSIILSSCGIRPLKRPENNIVGVDISNREETEPPESETEDDETDEMIDIPSTDEPDIYLHDYPLYEDGKPMGGFGLYPTYLSDEAYIAKHTIGYYYIQNKKTKEYIARFHNVCLPGEFEWDVRGAYQTALGDFAQAELFQMIELDNGMYAFLLPYQYTIHSIPLQRPVSMRKALTTSGVKPGTGHSILYFTSLNRLVEQSWLINKTASGAYTLFTRQMDEFSEGGVGVLSYVTKYLETKDLFWNDPIYNDVYTDDDDYSDEWIFVPAEPPIEAIP